MKIRLDAKVVANPTEEETRGISGATLPVVVRPSLEGHVTDLSLGLLMSTVTGLIDLIEDEIIPQPLPMKVIIFYYMYVCGIISRSALKFYHESDFLYSKQDSSCRYLRNYQENVCVCALVWSVLKIFLLDPGFS